MDRRRVLLTAAAVIAALGTLIVFLYVRGADDRAAEEFNAVPVLKAVKVIAAGESVAEAQAAGKIEESMVGENDRLPGALVSLDAIGGQLAQTTINPGEQIVNVKFADAPVSNSTLTIPKKMIAISVNLTDTGRVAGFVNPGDKVVIFATDGSATKTLLTDVQVIGVGTTTVVATTTTDATGAQTTEQLPRTLFTLGLLQEDAQRVIQAGKDQELSFGLTNKDSVVDKGISVDGKNLFTK